MSSVIIIGSGPAGVSAALYTARGGVDTTIISTGTGALSRAEKIENYYGFSEPVSGEELARRGIEGARRLGVKFIEEEAVSVSRSGAFTVKTSAGEYSADSVLLATGASRLAPPLAGLRELEGRGVSYCAVCDGFFFRGKAVGVLGAGEYALHEAGELQNITDNITVFTNSEAPAVRFPDSFRVVTEKLKRLSGEGALRLAETESGRSYEINGLFIAYKTAGSTALARKIGAATENNRITVDEKMQTSVDGLFAAGDCTGGLLQVSKAVYEGALAGTEIIKYLKSLK